MPPEVRPADASDRAALARTLADAFADDPVLGFLIRGGAARRSTFFTLELRRSIRLGATWTTADRDAAAIWLPPGKWRMSNLAVFLEGPISMWVLGRQTALAVRVLATMQQHHPVEPHWYLPFIGARPGGQSNGRGSALLRTVLDRCDEQRVPAYLEATTDRNRALYLRHGFEDRDLLTLPGGCPPLYPMWRDPR